MSENVITAAKIESMQPSQEELTAGKVLQIHADNLDALCKLALAQIRGKKTKLEVQVLNALKEGPATTTDIATLINKPIKNTSAYLCNLRREGHVKSWNDKPTRRGVETIWALP